MSLDGGPAPKTQLCIAMPAYNEAGCIEQVVRGWLSVFDSHEVSAARLIVVNDGSRDNTGEILDSLRASDPRLTVIHQENSGHGAALRHAYEQALALSPEWVFQVDSDDQFEVADFSLLWKRRAESKFILGRRRNRQDALHRLVISRILRILTFLLFRCSIPDPNIPFRLIQGEYLRSLLTRIPKGVFAPNVFLSILATTDGVPTLNIPVSHRDRRTGTVSIVKMRLIKACVRCAKELWALRQSLSAVDRG
jgi:dolichol-phosphate mannosyltransferase